MRLNNQRQNRNKVRQRQKNIKVNNMEEAKKVNDLIQLHSDKPLNAKLDNILEERDTGISFDPDVNLMYPDNGITDCVDAGVYYHPAINTLVNLITPHTVIIQSLYDYIKLATEQPKAAYMYTSDVISRIGEIYDDFLKNSLLSFFYSNNTDIMSDSLKRIISNFVKGYYADTFIKFIHDCVDIEKSDCCNGDKLAHIYGAICNCRNIVCGRIAANINDTINYICYYYNNDRHITNSNMPRIDELLLLDIEESLTGRDIKQFNNGDIWVIYERLQSRFTADFYNCYPIIEVLFWQCLQTYNYLNVDNYLSKQFSGDGWNNE